MLTKKELIPGVRYRGYAYVNEYGQINFDPEETGKRAGLIKMLHTSGKYTLKLTREHLLVTMKIVRDGDFVVMTKEAYEILSDLLVKARTYDLAPERKVTTRRPPKNRNNNDNK